jgi:hypothetical protein
MKNRPAILSLLGTLFCLEPLARLLVLKIRGQDLAQIGQALTGPYWFINTLGLILFPVIGLALLHPGKISRKLVVFGTLAYIAINSLYLKSSAQAISSSTLLFYVLSMVMTVSILTGILTSKISEVFTNSAMRWWEQAKRYRVSTKADIRPLLSNQIDDLEGQLLDISLDGARLSIPNNILTENDSLKIQSTVGEINLNLMARVAKIHPDGTLGLQFLSLNSERKKSLQKVLNSLEILETTLDRSKKQELHVLIRQELLA